MSISWLWVFVSSGCLLSMDLLLRVFCFIIVICLIGCLLLKYGSSD